MWGRRAERVASTSRDLPRCDDTGRKTSQGAKPYLSRESVDTVLVKGTIHSLGNDELEEDG